MLTSSALPKISRRCKGENGKEMYQNTKRTCGDCWQPENKQEFNSHTAGLFLSDAARYIKHNSSEHKGKRRLQGISHVLRLQSNFLLLKPIVLRRLRSRRPCVRSRLPAIKIPETLNAQRIDSGHFCFK